MHRKQCSKLFTKYFQLCFDFLLQRRSRQRECDFSCLFALCFVCVCVGELKLFGRKIKKTLGTCKRTLHNQMNGMAIGAALVLHDQVVGARVVLVGVVNVQRGQVAILTCILQQVVGTEAI